MIVNDVHVLQTFPAPLCFNKDTGGFEVVTDAKKELAKQIKAAIRSQRRTPKIYNVVKQHSFSNIPLIPIEEPDEPENLEINTSFTVTVSWVPPVFCGVKLCVPSKNWGTFWVCPSVCQSVCHIFVSPTVLK